MHDDLDTPYDADTYLAKHPAIAAVLPRQKLYAAARGHIGDGLPALAVLRMNRRVFFTHRAVLEFFAARTIAQTAPMPIAPRAPRKAKAGAL